MKTIILGQTINILHTDGSNATPREVGIIAAGYMLGVAVGQLRLLGATDEDIRATFELGMVETASKESS